MSKSAILQMYYGERGCYEFVPRSGKYEKLLDAFLACERDLHQKLANTPELFALYEKTKDALERLNGESAENHYCEGFRFGLLMGLDAAQTPDIVNDEPIA